MRLTVRCRLDRPTAFPLNHQHQLAGLVYRLLEISDAEYARFLHDEGYGGEEDGSRRFKLFVFSHLRSPRRRLEGDTLWLGPGTLEWLVGSPVAPFLQHCATGLLAAGALSVAGESVPIETVETLPAPRFNERARFTCLTPIVATVPRPQGSARYLRPADGEEFSEAARRNLVRKYRLIHGRPPEDDRLRLTFDPEHLARHRHGGTKKITYKNIDVIGAFLPFTLEGSPELMGTGWECGLGEKNAGGFGMVEVAR
jgi:CRISPR-associated endoribonuclease Cas6